MEANIVRPFVTKALQTFHKLNTSDTIPESGRTPNRQRQAMNQRDKVKFLRLILPFSISTIFVCVLFLMIENWITSTT